MAILWLQLCLVPQCLRPHACEHLPQWTASRHAWAHFPTKLGHEAWPRKSWISCLIPRAPADRSHINVFWSETLRICYEADKHLVQSAHYFTIITQSSFDILSSSRLSFKVPRICTSSQKIIWKSPHQPDINQKMSALKDVCSFTLNEQIRTAHTDIFKRSAATEHYIVFVPPRREVI